MATAVGFTGANVVFECPDNIKDCYDIEAHADGRQVTTCWRLTEAELREVARTGVVWQVVMGQGIHPSYLTGEAPVIDGKIAKGEPVLKRRIHGG